MRTLVMKPIQFSGRLFAAVVMLLLCVSCAAPPAIPDAERPSHDTMLARLDASRNRFETLKGLGKYRFRQHDRTFAASQVILAEDPDHLRVETLGLFGSPAMLLATDGARATVLLPGEGKAFLGDAGPRILQQFMQLPLRIEDVVSILLVHPLLPAWDSDSVRFDADGTVLVLNNAYGMQQEVVFDRQLQIVRFDYFLAGGLQMRIIYGEYDPQSGFPRHIELQLPLDDIEMTLDFNTVDVNVVHKQGRFVLTPPAGYELYRLEGGA